LGKVNCSKAYDPVALSEKSPFFAQLSELYNALPNVFILFTMTVRLREQLYPKMERQFQHRIRRDQKFVLREIHDDELLSVYRRRVALWLGEDNAELRRQLAEPEYRYLPFTQEEILGFSRQKLLREALEEMDRRFRGYLVQQVTSTDPRFEFLVSLNELRRGEAGVPSFHYTAGHLTTVTELVNRAGPFFAAARGLVFGGLEEWSTESGLPALRLEFRSPEQTDLWVRFFLARLPFRYNQKLEECLALLSNLWTDHNFLWLVRPDRVDDTWEARKPGQVFARVLPASSETSMKAMLRLLEKQDKFTAEAWKGAEQVLLGEFKLTYLGELFQEAAEALDRLKGQPAPAGGR
jgi:hypothetical protein